MNQNIINVVKTTFWYILVDSRLKEMNFMFNSLSACFIISWYTNRLWYYNLLINYMSRFPCLHALELRGNFFNNYGWSSIIIIKTWDKGVSLAMRRKGRVLIFL